MGYYGIKDGTISPIEDDEAEFEFASPNAFFGSNVNLIPMQNAVQGPRLFYGARFFNQALPLAKPQAPLVQSSIDNDPDGYSFDDRYGRRAGARFADEDGVVLSVKDRKITYKNAAGEKKEIELYHNFPFNRKTSLHQRPIVQPGSKFTKGQIMAASNYTDDAGTLALGTNARVGVVPYKGFSMDDAIVVSESMRHKLSSQHSYMTEQEFDNDVKGGRSHFHALFPTTFTKDQLELMDMDGVIKEGMTVRPGDPLVLATKPRVISSQSAQLGRLSRAMQQTRSDASKIWEGETEGTVTDVARTKNGVKVVVATTVPGQKGDKIVFRSGQKGVISQIIPDDHMPRTMDGKPLEVLLNPLGIPSRANDSILYELLLGKVAEKSGKPYKLPTFNGKDENWYDFVEQQLKEAGVDPKDEVFDPLLNKKLENPITVGVGHILKLHHTAESKSSSRGQGGYCYDPATEVWTSRGWIPWPEVAEEDLLATLDGDDRIVFEKPKELIAFDYDGDLYGFEGGRYVDYLVTPEHDHWVKFGKPNSEYRKVPAEKLHGRRFYVKQQGFEYAGSKDPDKVVISYEGPIEEGSGPRSKEFEFSWIDYVELMGWWLTEGSVREKEGKCFIWQHLSANTDNFRRIEDLLTRMGLPHHIHKNTGGLPVGFCISSKTLSYHMIRACGGRKSGDKSIPANLLHSSLKSRLLLFEVMMLGDGYIRGGNYSSKSKGLLDTFQILVTGLGWSGCVADREARENDQGYLCSPNFYLGISTKRKNATVCERPRYSGRFVKRPYKGLVYCARMGGRGLLYVRRNGKPMWSGNSLDEQPLKGGGEGAAAKRLSGLEVHGLLSAGAYGTLREGATVRGQRNDEYWRAIRQGHTPKEPGKPFVWGKFKALLMGAGMEARDVGDGNLRLGPFTDRSLAARNPIEVQNGEIVNLKTQQLKAGGLFDKKLTGANQWGQITLDEPVPNPAFEDSIRRILGLKRKDLLAILDGTMELPEHLR